MGGFSGGAVLSFAGAVMGLAVLLGGVIAVMLSQLRRNTTSIVREENEDLRQRLASVEAQEKECKEALATQAAAHGERMAKAEATMKVLSDMVTGASAVVELTTVVSTNHSETLNRLAAIDQRLAKVGP